MATTERGLTLIEMILVVAIGSFIFGVAVPAFSGAIERNKAAIAINWIVAAIHYTRHAALVHRTMTTLCPSTNQRTCGGRWHNGILVFTDRNGNHEPDGQDQVLQTIAYPFTGSTLTWRSFGNRQYLQMTAYGYTNYQNGNFVYCSQDQNPRFARQIVINIQGRVRTSRDRNDDGLVEDRRNKPLRC